MVEQSIVRVKLLGHTDSVNTLQYADTTSNLPKCLLSASDDGTCRLWDLRSNKGVMLLEAS
jgi:WD40 repeat protein